MYFNHNSGVLLIFFRNLNTSVYFFNQTKISETFIIHQFWSVGIIFNYKSSVLNFITVKNDHFRENSRILLNI